MNKNGRLDFHTYFQAQVEKDESVGRVTTFTHGIYTISTESNTLTGELSGKFHYNCHQVSDYPAVGDWVVFQPFENDTKALIHRVLNRQTLLSRKKAGTSNDEQVIAANIDKVFIVTALTKEFNERRLERYVQQVYESGAIPVIVCTKRDLCENVEEKLASVQRAAPGVPFHAIDNMSGGGVEELSKELISGETISLIGSSGVGKSTLINRLMNKSVQSTQEVRSSDDRGRHTTTHRELFQLLNGTYIIDTPGMRELQLWGDEMMVDTTFSDIDELATNCKFRNCKHEKEPGCAVRIAIESGELEEERLKSYNKLKRELFRLDLKDRYGTHKTNRMLHGSNKNEFLHKLD
ncbi:ribosome small subunit-dependent GTPase A [Halobacillus yeomjeoni]|uniref:Small ribosomal subunit biogenesis GTPase RsgA n=1 Tax=Halobacillus yeomjeoni TaxID=311194 RepID=A0A931HT48_9BACI|nr:ribosome small subunit-dependent GTPase A [Halobacillus yeomjeoni]MBH0228918.1 ribosome small subunit-dependent GTPase A [Halobacillus yeomjeoni]